MGRYMPYNKYHTRNHQMHTCDTLYDGCDAYIAIFGKTIGLFVEFWIKYSSNVLNNKYFAFFGKRHANFGRSFGNLGISQILGKINKHVGKIFINILKTILLKLGLTYLKEYYFNYVELVV